MCMICVVRNWCRRVVRVLPWLVIPLIGLWALSQLLAPGLRLEISSPRLACVVVLVGTIFWYEVLLPQLAVYQARRLARARERQQMQVVELEKLRKQARRRCRNCLAIYREQNPGGGKFICSCCGHVSKRPVLDLPGPPQRSGFISKFTGNNSWFCRQDNSAEGSEIFASPFSHHSVMSSEERFSTEKSYLRDAVFMRKLRLSFFSCVKWFHQRVLRLSSYAEDRFSSADHKGLSRKGENGMNCQEDRGEKARRKAEEKRQARLEKEMLEEEERKQREEVARLIEERRKLRDENLEAEKERLKGLASDGERESRKESEKRRRDRRKEKDKSSSKSNSDGEGHEKRGTRETEKRHEYEKKTETEKWDPCNPVESQKINRETVNSVKGMENKSKHFDCTKGASFSSSKSLNGTVFFGKGSHTATVPVTKSSKPIGGFVDHMRRRESHAVEHAIGKSLSNADAKTIGTIYPQHTQTGGLKRSWHQLFTSYPAGLPCPDVNTVDRLNQIGQPEFQTSQLVDQKVPSHHFDNQMHFEQSSAFTARTLMSSTLTGNSASVASEPKFLPAGEQGHNCTRAEAETFEDPCYVTDPISLIGPDSESLDNFLDAGSGFTADFRSDCFHVPKSASDSADANKPSPIESPMIKLRLSEERHSASGPPPSKSQDHGDAHSGESNDINGQGTWQMWSSPLCHDLLELVGAPPSCLLAPRQNNNTHAEIIHPPVCSPMASHAVKENNTLQNMFNHSQNVHFGNCQNDGMMSSVTPILTENDPWLQENLLHPFPGDERNHFAPLDFNCSASLDVMVSENPERSTASQTLGQLPSHCWSKDWVMRGEEDIGISNISKSDIPGFIPANPGVQTVWSFN